MSRSGAVGHYDGLGNWWEPGFSLLPRNDVHANCSLLSRLSRKRHLEKKSRNYLLFHLSNLLQRVTRVDGVIVIDNFASLDHLCQELLLDAVVDVAYIDCRQPSNDNISGVFAGLNVGLQV